MGAGKFAKGLGMIMGTRPTESTIGTAIRLGMIGKDAEGKVRYRTRTQEGKYKFGGLVAGQDEVISKVRDFQRSAAMGYGELGFSTQAIQRMAASTRIAVTKEYGAEPEKWAAIKEASKGNAQTALWRRIKELRKSDAEIDEAFSKFEGDQGRQFALLRELERESGISGTTLRSDVSGAVGFEAGFSELETTLEGMEKMEADAFRALSKAEIDEGTDFKFGGDRSYKKGGAPGRMRRGGKARPGEGGGKAWGGHSVADLGRTKVLGVATAEVDAETMKQLWSNSQIKDEMMKWRFGSGDEKAKAMSNLLMWANTDPNERGDGAPTISESQRNALRGLSTVMQKGSRDAEFAIGRLARIDAGKATMAIKRRERELGTELKDRLSTAETEARFAAAEGGMGVLEKLRQIQDIRISGGEGSLKRTAEMERNLLMSLANASPDVMEAIQNTPGAEYLSQGLTYGRQLAEHLSRKKGVGRTQALIQKTLGVYGLGELGGKIGQEKMKEISRLVEAGDREKALQLMETAAGEAGGAVKDLFTQRKGLVERMMKVGEAGVTDEEAKEAGVGLAGTSLGGLRVKGAKQEVMATSELQAKILKQMETSVNIEKAMLLKQVSADDFEKFIKKTKVLDEPGGEE